MAAIAAAKELKQKQKEEREKQRAEKAAEKAKQKAEKDAEKEAKAKAKVIVVNEKKNKEKDTKKRRRGGYSSDEDDEEEAYYENWNPDADENPDINVTKVNMKDNDGKVNAKDVKPNKNAIKEAKDKKQIKETEKKKQKDKQKSKSKDSAEIMEQNLLRVPSDSDDEDDEEEDDDEGDGKDETDTYKGTGSGKSKGVTFTQNKTSKGSVSSERADDVSSNKKKDSQERSRKRKTKKASKSKQTSNWDDDDDGNEESDNDDDADNESEDSDSGDDNVDEKTDSISRGISANKTSRKQGFNDIKSSDSRSATDGNHNGDAASNTRGNNDEWGGDSDVDSKSQMKLNALKNVNRKNNNKKSSDHNSNTNNKNSSMTGEHGNSNTKLQYNSQGANNGGEASADEDYGTGSEDNDSAYFEEDSDAEHAKNFDDVEAPVQNIPQKKAGFFSRLFGGGNKNSKRTIDGNAKNTHTNDRTENGNGISDLGAKTGNTLQKNSMSQSNKTKQQPTYDIYDERNKDSLFYKDPKQKRKKIDYGDWNDEPAGKTNTQNTSNQASTSASRVPSIFMKNKGNLSDNKASPNSYLNPTAVTENGSYDTFKNNRKTPMGYMRTNNGTMKRKLDNMNPITPIGFAKNADGTILPVTEVKQQQGNDGLYNAPFNHDQLQDPGKAVFHGLQNENIDSRNDPIISQPNANERAKFDALFKAKPKRKPTSSSDHAKANPPAYVKNQNYPHDSVFGGGKEAFNGLSGGQKNNSFTQNGFSNHGSTNGQHHNSIGQHPNKQAFDPNQNLFNDPTGFENYNNPNSFAPNPVFFNGQKNMQGLNSSEEFGNEMSNVKGINQTPNMKFNPFKNSQNQDIPKIQNPYNHSFNQNENPKGPSQIDSGHGSLNNKKFYNNPNTDGLSGNSNGKRGTLQQEGNGSNHNPNEQRFNPNIPGHNPNSNPHGSNQYPNGQSRNQIQKGHGFNQIPNKDSVNQIPEGKGFNQNANTPAVNQNGRHNFNPNPNGQAFNQNPSVPSPNQQGLNQNPHVHSSDNNQSPYDLHRNPKQQGKDQIQNGQPFDSNPNGLDGKIPTNGHNVNQYPYEQGKNSNPNAHPNPFVDTVNPADERDDPWGQGNNDPDKTFDYVNNPETTANPMNDQTHGKDPRRGGLPVHADPANGGQYTRNPSARKKGMSPNGNQKGSLGPGSNDMHPPENNGGPNNPIVGGPKGQGKKLVSFRNDSPYSNKTGLQNDNDVENGKPNQSNKNGPDDGIEELPAGETETERRTPVGYNQKPAWQNSLNPGSKENKRGSRTPVKELAKITRSHSLTEPEPVFATDRLAKRFPFLSTEKKDPEKANAGTVPIRKNQSDSNLGKMAKEAALNNFLDGVPKKSNVAGSKSDGQVQNVNPEMRNKIFYGFGVGRWRYAATKWLNNWKMKKKPVKTVDSAWD